MRTFTGVGLALTVVVAAMAAQTPPEKINIAHRGASGYAPEHTLAAYRLALDQGADFVEQDLAVTKDGVLICLHDASLERTTDVEEVFPGRATTVSAGGRTRTVWLANDFTLAEIKQLDAGSWFAPTFAGERVPTFDEAVALVKGRAGLFPELKTPEMYAGRDVPFEALVAAALDRHHLRGAGANPKSPVILQTFSQASARTLAQMKIGVPVVLLFGSGDRWQSPQAVQAWKGIVTGLGPEKAIVAKNPALVQWAHAAGLTVTPYTFSATDSSDVQAEMARFLYELGVDGLFTDNPDLFPRR